jgi:hypothetical protein
LKTINKHNRYYLFLKTTNEVAKTKLLIYYYVLITYLAICSLIVQLNQTQPIVRFYFAFLICWVVFVVSFINTILSSVSLAIHNSYPLLCELIAKHSSRMKINLKLKLINLIEKLSKKRMGFTCYDCFTFCYFELFIFYVNLISTYILFYGLMK